VKQVMKGTIPQADLLAAIGIDVGTASAFGAMDNTMMRAASLDADGNGVLDAEEGLRFDLTIFYEFRTSQHFSALGADFADPAAVSPEGYQYIYGGTGYCAGTLDWASGALLTPAPIDASSTWTQAAHGQTGDLCGLNFNDMSASGPPIFSSPLTPPSGNYVVEVPKLAGGVQDFTFNRYGTRSVDLMQEVLVPSIKYTVGQDGSISLLEWRWMIKPAGSDTWGLATDEQLALILDRATFDLYPPAMTGGVNGTVGTTATGSVVPPAQTVAPTSSMISYWEKGGFGYVVNYRP
jgi:hypothetical protein